MAAPDVREHFRVWNLYWIAGIIVALLLAAAVWLTYLAIDAAATWKAVRGPTPLSKLRAEATEKSPENRVANLILPYATIDELNMTLYLPNVYQHVRGIGYHESSHTRAYSMKPIGHLLKNDNAWDLEVELNSTAPLPTYNIMESRGEYAAGTTVSDIALDPGTPVLPPISGTITKITPIVIYDEHQDMQIEMRPDGYPNVVVAFLHVDQIKVKPGDHVIQGKTVIGIPKDWRGVIPSEVDDYVKPVVPHVHIQVDTPAPPEAPAQ